MSSNSYGVSLLRSALLAVAATLSFATIASARVPDECRRAPLSVRCVKALWRGGHATNGTKGTNAPEGAEDGQRDRRAPRRVVPYAGPPPVANAHAVKTPPLRKMPVIPPPKRGESVERREPVRPARPADDRPADTGRQSAMGPERSAPGSAGVSFEGVGTGMPGFSVAANPPDVNGRVGSTQYVQWNNLSFAIWDKSGKLLYGPAAGNTLFQPLGGVCASHNDGDPVVNYDILAGRWILSQFALEASPGFSHQCVAVSVTDDATGSYYLYDFVTDNTNFVDYPHMAVWPDGYYMASNVFDAGGSALIAARISVFERDKMLKGQTARQLSADLKKYGNQPQYGFLVADVDSAIPPPAGEAEFVLGPDPSTTSLFDSTRVAVTWGTTPSIALTETTISAGWSLAPCIGGGRACVPQPTPASSSAYLDSLDQHIMHRLAYRNFGGTPAQESLVANMTVTGSTSTPPHGAIRWFEFRNTGSSTTAPTVLQAATFDPDTHYRWMGSIAMDKDHDIALGYSKSSTTVIPSIWVNGRLGTDPINTLGAETQMQAGGGVQLSGGGNRWGDYSAMSLDPIDQCTFWYTNEYLPSNGTFNWATRIASFKFPSCTGTEWGTVSGTITSCPTGGPLGGVVVSLDNGYSGSSDAAGHYAILVPAGTYALSAAAADRNCTAGSPATVSVIVPVGGSVSQNFCMTGSSALALSAFAVDDSAAGNGNGIVNRNECANLNVTIANNGCADESGITATLTTSTPGVTVTQGSSFYPNLAIDAAAKNAVPFRFQTSSTFVCGTVINFTLNLTYAGGSKSVGIDVPTCSGGAALTIPVSALTLSDPTQGDRLFRDGNASDCSGKICPDGYGSGETFNYKVFKFTNSGGGAACVTVKIDAACGGSGQVESAAYLGSTYNPPAFEYDPKLCTNYLGDAGLSAGSTLPSVSYSFNVPAHADFVVVANTVFQSSTCAQFSGTVTGFFDDTSGPGPCPACTPPAAPTISASGPTAFCVGGSVTLTSSAASGNQWYRNGAGIAGATGASYAAAAGGSYTVTTGANGCISAPSAATAVTVNPTPATPAPSNGGPFCAGSTITLSTPAVAGATYAWTGPNGFTSSLQNPTRANAAAADAGTYSLTVTVSGCPSSAGTTAVVVNPIPATPAPSNNGPYCLGQTISLSTPSVSGATYHWTGPNSFTSTAQNPTRPNATLADAGTYLVTVTANGCPSAAGTTSVAVSSTPATPAASNAGPFCAGSTISLSTATVAGATYAWTGPNGFTSALQNPTRANAAAADAGAYSVTVTVNGCPSAAGTTNVVVNTAIPATPAATNSGPFCEGSTISLSTPLVASATYAWTGPNGFTSTLQNPTRANATAADAGTYSVTVTVGGCSSAAGTTSVAVTPKPATPTASNGGPYCEGSTIALSTPLVAGATYAWTGPNGFTSTVQNPTRASAAAADFGTYSVTVTVNGCTSAAGTTTVVDSNAAQAASNGGPYCAGGTISLFTPAVPGATYAWTGPNGFTSTDQNPTRASATLADAGMYSVIVTTSGCTSLAGATDVVVNASVATPAPANGGPYCAGGTISLSTAAVPGATYAWTGPNGFTSSLQNPTRANAAPADAGIYSVTVFNGCTSAAGNTTVVVNAAPAAPVPSNSGPYCAGGTISLSTPAVANAAYAWTGPNGFTSSQQNPTRANATAADAGTYSVTVTVAGCTSPAGTTNVAVNSIAAPLPANGGPYCAGSTIALATPIVAGATYAWTGPNGFTSSLPNPTRIGATPADAGAYSVTVTSNGCVSAAGTTSVAVYAIPSAPVPSNGGPYCAGSTISLSTSAVANAAYAWTGPNGFTSSQQNPTIASATTANGGTYSVIVTVNGCSSPAGTTSVVVHAIPATPAPSNTGPYCSSGTISLTTTAVANAAYAWTGPNGFTSTLQNPTIANATAAMAGAYSVTVTVSGCTSASGATSVVVNAKPATPTASNTGPYCSGATVQLNATTVAGATYSWTGPNGFTSALQNPTIASATTAAAGTYSVTATANGCTSSAAGTTSVAITAVSSSIFTSGPTTFCAGGSVTLNSNFISGNQWLRDGAPIPGATSQSYAATVSGSYTHIATANGCPSPPSNAIVVTVNPRPDATMTGNVTAVPGQGGIEQVADAGVGAGYAWTIANGTITSGNGTRSIAFIAGPFGAVTVTVTVSVASGCMDAKSRSVPIQPVFFFPTPAAGRAAGGSSVTITGAGFQSGASVTFGGVPATKVVRVSSTTITATTPPHAPAAVDVSVKNPDNLVANALAAFTYLTQQFDPNNDKTIDPADIFYLINYLFTSGPAPKGQAGMLSGDANNDGVVDPADIFYLINFIFTSGPAPMSLPPRATATFTGSITLGAPIVRDGRTFVPVIVAGGAAKPHALSLRVRGSGIVAIRRVTAAAPVFENAPVVDGGAAWLASFGANEIGGVVAEIEVTSDAHGLELDPALTMLTDQSGAQNATAQNGRLRISPRPSRSVPR